MTNKEMEMYDYIVESGIATTDELNLVRNLVNGTWEEILNMVVYVRTGYISLGSLLEAEAEEEEEE